MRNKIPYYIRLGIIIIILTSPIPVFKLAGIFLEKEDGLLFAFAME